MNILDEIKRSVSFDLAYGNETEARLSLANLSREINILREDLAYTQLASNPHEYQKHLRMDDAYIGYFTMLACVVTSCTSVDQRMNILRTFTPQPSLSAAEMEVLQFALEKLMPKPKPTLLEYLGFRVKQIQQEAIENDQ